MTFRTRLLIAFSLTVIVAVVFVGAIVSTTTRRAFGRLDDERVSALAAQFHQEFLRRQREIAEQVKDIADADSTREMVIALSRPDADPAVYVDAAPPLATAHNLDFLELVSAKRQHHFIRAMAGALSLPGGLGEAAGRLELPGAVPKN